MSVYIYIAKCNIYVIDVKGSDENYARRGHAYGLATDVPNLFQIRFIFIFLFFFFNQVSPTACSLIYIAFILYTLTVILSAVLFCFFVI